jgi:protein SCO1/2
MPRIALALAAAVLLAGCGGGSTSGVQSQTTPYRGSAVVDPPIAPDFALHDQAGQLVRLASYRGGWTVVTFLYTHCPDVCPIIASQLNQALRRLGPGRLHVFAISVDPRGDTPAAVRQFVAAHRLVPSFRYLTGTVAQLRRVWHAYHIAVDPDSKTTAVNHSAFEILVDPRGREKLYYDSQVKAGDVVHDVRLLERS